MAFLPDGIPLGFVWQKTWARDSIATDVPAKIKNKKRQETPIEEKESILSDRCDSDGLIVLNLIHVIIPP